MKKPICVKCQVEFRMDVAGVIVKEMFQQNTEIYKIWRADLWKCPSCGDTIIFGFAEKPDATHHEKERIQAVLDEIEKGDLEVEGKVFYNKEYFG